METYQTPADFGNEPKGIVRRWMMELKLADKREEDFIKTGKKIWDVYRGKGRKKNSFNILWSNTETLKPALFNSPPEPNVRRRFKDADPVGKVGSEVLERCLSFQTDTEPFYSAIELDVLDMLLPGRGLSRIRYVPSLVQVGTPQPNEGAEEPSHEVMEGETEELDWEQAVLEHVQWDDFRHGPGKTWAQVPWVAFRHRLNREDLRKLAPEFADRVTLDEPADEDLKKDDDLCEVFQTAEVWEIWCKDERKVYFIAKSFRDAPLKALDDPLNLSGFFPLPKPLMAISDSSSLEPVPLYEQYKEQAEELNRISTRINKIIDACKVRGIYDSTMSELAELMRAADNDLVPAQNAAMWAEKGGFEKGIWMWPAETAAKVLQILYQQRADTKQVIYEITGIADVMRGATDPNETLGAQQLKAQWGGQRVQAMQREVQRYVRDFIRLMSEIVAEKFQPETLLKMSGLQIPTQAQVQQQMMPAQSQAAQSGQPPQMPAQPPVTLEQVVQVLRDDASRMFKIDVETDSMIAATMEQDMQGLRDLLTGVQGVLTAFGPAVQMGAIPIDAPKELLLAIFRRSKLGSAVEDAFDKMQAPQQQGDPAAIKAEADAKLKQQQQEHDQAIAMRQQQHAEMVAQREQAHAEQLAVIEQRREEQRLAMEQRIAAAELAQNERQAQMEAALAQFKAILDAKTKVEVAEISAGTTVQTAQISAAAQATAAEASE